ncbi:MAG TPA: prepilin peptidase, partial [Blastocatellia bacterium]|nr:prepilin peptidase [Blastocatellia bacterium]
MEISFALSAFFAFAFGLIIGSFLNVVIHRVPRGESIVFPGSHCPACGRSIRAFDNIPVLSFLWLKARCRGCQRRISPIYPFVELLTGLVFLAIFLKSGPTWELSLEMIFAGLMLALIFIDARHHLLPNAITYPAFVFALAAAALRSGWGHQIADTVDLSLIVPLFDSEFVAWRAALFGGLLLAGAAPGFWLLDYLDVILFNKYFEWEEMNKTGEGETAAEEQESPPAGIYLAMALGLLLAVAWAVAVIKFSSPHLTAYPDAYHGLLRAGLGALIGSGLIWWLRAFYFYARGLEGMGLGDVKMMAIIGAFLDWQGMLQVLLLGSALG